MKKYLILYTFSTEEGNYGHGEVEIVTDKPIESHDDLMEVSRNIAKSKSGIITLAINKVTELDG